MMNNKEMIAIYSLMHQLDDYLIKNEKYYNHNNGFFALYETLNIPPVPVHIKNEDIKEAIFIFSEGIVKALDEVEEYKKTIELKNGSNRHNHYIAKHKTAEMIKTT
ncbi:MAG: UPF0058 family protein [Candidatus Aenigmarchaeota archaeon]|nr:UPF0058 family protein [Candidatus Aenigmarchaeota archaeon]